MFMLATDTATTTVAGFDIGSIVMIVAMVGILYFMMIRPNNKKKKEEAKMRDALQVGDEITTTGGMVGRVVSIKEDSILFETGNNKTTIRLLKSSIYSVTPLKLDE